VTRHNLYELHVDNDDRLIDQNGDLFDVAAYSRFKYGQADTGRMYALALARDFIAAYPDAALHDDKIVVSGPSYKYLSTASHGIVHHFCMVLNAYRMQRGLEPVQQLHSIRSTVGSDAYAAGDAALRATHLAKSKYHIDTEMVRGSLFIFIDDVNVTGATEERTLERTIPCEPSEIFCLHVAAIDPAYAETNAAIENVMNKAVPLSLHSIRTLIREDNFRLNTRVFRSIMEWNNIGELERFLLSQKESTLLEMYAALVGGTSEMYGRFPAATMTFEQVLRRRGLSVML
jgi:hypothetical protein